MVQKSTNTRRKIMVFAQIPFFYLDKNYDFVRYTLAYKGQCDRRKITIHKVLITPFAAKKTKNNTTTLHYDIVYMVLAVLEGPLDKIYEVSEWWTNYAFKTDTEAQNTIQTETRNIPRTDRLLIRNKDAALKTSLEKRLEEIPPKSDYAHISVLYEPCEEDALALEKTFDQASIAWIVSYPCDNQRQFFCFKEQAPAFLQFSSSTNPYEQEFLQHKVNLHEFSVMSRTTLFPYDNTFDLFCHKFSSA